MESNHVYALYCVFDPTDPSSLLTTNSLTHYLYRLKKKKKGGFKIGLR